MRVQIASEPGSASTPNEDHAAAGHSLAVVVDGLTARTESGCIHGVGLGSLGSSRKVFSDLATLDQKTHSGRPSGTPHRCTRTHAI